MPYRTALSKALQGQVPGGRRSVPKVKVHFTCSTTVHRPGPQYTGTNRNSDLAVVHRPPVLQGSHRVTMQLPYSELHDEWSSSMVPVAVNGAFSLPFARSGLLDTVALTDYTFGVSLLHTYISALAFI